jgi:hypothetical protein
MRALITGIARSGTSALYFKLKQALPETTWCLFEPPQFDAADLYRQPDVLAKVVIGPPADFDYAPFRGFERKIMIVRDPRDNLVSRLLYHPCGTAAFREDETKVVTFINALRLKEADPRSVPVMALIDLTHVLTGYYRLDWSTLLYDVALDFHRANDDFVVYKYEDFVAGRYAVLEDYLQIQLPAGEADVTAQYRHVERTKATNSWRDWFTADDVAYFRSRLSSFMTAYGYADDWTLAAEPQISPAHGSDFVRRSVAQRNLQA